MHLFRKWLQKTRQNKIPFILGSFFVFGLLFIPSSVYAVEGVVADTLSNVGNAFMNGILILISSILEEVVGALGKFMVIIIDFIRAVAKYDGFRSQEQVIKGWQIVRDTVNSFYVIVLIAIAISTIIRWKPLDFRVALPRLIISAVIVNFSRTICLFAIGFSTILMNTFINAIGGAWPAFILGLRAPAILALQDATVQGLVEGEFAKSPPIQAWNVIVSQLFAIVILVVAIVPLVAFLLILLFRIIALWILIILSPLAFFLWGLVVKGTEYFNEWKNEFIKQILIGPVFAFFLYIIVLFFISNAQTVVEQSNATIYGIDLNSTAIGTRPLPSFISEPSLLLGYVVGIALMFVTLEVANRIGARGTGTAIGFGKKVQGGLLKATKSAFRAADDFVYSKNIPLVPTFRGAQQAATAISTGFAAKRQGYIEEGAQKRSQIAQDLEGQRPGSIRAAVANLGAGNSEFIKASALVFSRDSLAARLLPQDILGNERTTTTDDLHVEATEIENRQNAKKGFNNLDANLQNLVAGRSLNQVRSNRIDLENSIDQLNQRKERYDQMDALLQQNADLIDDDAFREEYEQLEQSVGTDQQYSDQLDALEGQRKDLKDVEELFGKDGVNIADGQTIGGYVQQDLSDANQRQDSTRLQTVLQRMNERKAQAQIAGAGIRSDLRKKGKEYREVAYEKDEKYSVEILAANAAGNANKRNVPEFQEDIIKAADQGAFDDVYRALIPDFTMDHAGLEKAHKFNQDAGMSEQQSLELLSRAEGRHWSDKKALQTGFTKTDKTGKLRLTSSAEQQQVIRKNIENALKDVLTKGGKDAVGVKQRDGSYELHEAALAAMKKEVGTLQKMLEDNRVITTIPRETREMIKKNADALGLRPASRNALNEVT